MPCYHIRMTFDIHVEAETAEDAIDQIEAGLEDDPLYGPFNYDVIGESDIFPMDQQTG